MDISFLIVTKNRPDELRYTLSRLQNLVTIDKHEVLVFIDGCVATHALVTEFGWVKWTVWNHSISASPARAILYQKAVGTIFIGLDDDAHPISADFIPKVQQHFETNPQLGILAFQEVKGIYPTDDLALLQAKNKTSFYTNDFVGCGFAIAKKVYAITNGFPTWIDIYGEEPCVAFEVLDTGYSIFFAHDIVVNHRIDIEKRKLQGKNYFRFERQLRNSFKLYLVYYPNPLPVIARLLFHNFKRYACTDFVFFKLYWRAVGHMIFTLFDTLKYRSPIQKKTLKSIQKLKNMPY